MAVAVTVTIGSTITIHGLTGRIIHFNDAGTMAYCQFDGFKDWKPIQFMQRV